jgi:hypothetical protein
MILPFLLAADAEPTALIIAGLGAAVSGMAMFIAGIALAKLNKLTTKDEEHAGEIHKQDLRLTKVEVRSEQNEKRIDGLVDTTLSERVFDERTKAQDDRLRKIDENVRALDRSKASRSDLRAVQGPPTPRKDGPYAIIPREDPPSDPPPSDPPDPPPVRPRLPSSRGRYGGE